ncbi:DUF6207 family protein [Streptomyces sp. NPDC002671]
MRTADNRVRPARRPRSSRRRAKSNGPRPGLSPAPYSYRGAPQVHEVGRQRTTSAHSARRLCRRCLVPEPAHPGLRNLRRPRDRLRGPVRLRRAARHRASSPPTHSSKPATPTRWAAVDDATALAFQAALAEHWATATATAERMARTPGEPGVRLRCCLDVRQKLTDMVSPGRRGGHGPARLMARYHGPLRRTTAHHGR